MYYSEGNNGGGGGPEHLASRTLELENKTFYLDVEENQRGRFIKIAEVSSEGRRNQVLMTFSTAAQFSENLVKFSDFYKDLRRVNPNNLAQGELKSAVMFEDDNDKKYHMDLKENARGRFLKLSEVTRRGNGRFQVFIPTDGMREIHHNLEDLIGEYDNGDTGVMDSEDNQYNAGSGKKHVKIENKDFYFEVKSNQQGRYMAISEQKGSNRNTILVPESGWESFQSVINECVKETY